MFIPQAAARIGHIAALSTTGENATIGGVVDISLEVQPGHGAIYIESMPLTKLDTQMSARLAAEAACERSTEDCRRYDFFYVIRTEGGVIGGPSAGAALAVLTYAVLENLPIRNDTAITGAILPGGVIGPVGAVPEKVRGAAAAKYKYVLVPAFDDQDATLREQASAQKNDSQNSSQQSSRDNSQQSSQDTYEQYGISTSDETVNESSYAQDEMTMDRITVIRIRTLDDAIKQFTGRAPKQVEPLLAPPQAYTQNMARIASMLCDRARIVRSSIDTEDERVDTERLRGADRQYARAMNASGRSAFYTSASQCFGASLVAQEILLTTADNESRDTILDMVKRNRNALREAIEKAELRTITDLEVAMIATERLSDVERALTEMNTSNPTPAQLAYATERLETARAWFSVLGSIESTKLDLSQEALDASCRAKLNEARERVNYASYLFPEVAASLEESVRDAFSAAQRQHSALCILQASQAKAEANAVLTAFSVPQEDFAAVTARKAAIARERIAAQTAKGTFPILAFSYDEYATFFTEEEIASAALYTEYSLELATLPTAFSAQTSAIRVDPRTALIFGLGSLLGIILGLIGGYVLYRPARASHTESQRKSRKVRK